MPDRTCRKCGATMQPGKALAQTFVGGSPDFPGDDHATTFSAGGHGQMIDCLKCPECGWSVTDGGATVELNAARDACLAARAGQA